VKTALSSYTCPPICRLLYCSHVMYDIKYKIVTINKLEINIIVIVIAVPK
jgi:hypothetical protein